MMMARLVRRCWRPAAVCVAVAVWTPWSWSAQCVAAKGGETAPPARSGGAVVRRDSDVDALRKGVYARASKTALLVVDCQPAFYAGSATIPKQFPALPGNVARLLRAARASGVHVIHINAHYEPSVSPWLQHWSLLRAERVAQDPRVSKGDKPVLPGSSTWAAPLASEPVIVKHTINGFFDTRLLTELRARGVTHVVVCGLVTSICVQGTASGAEVRGFSTAVVPECCGDHNRTRHDNTLALYGNNMFALATVDELERAWSTGTSTA